MKIVYSQEKCVKSALCSPPLTPGLEAIVEGEAVDFRDMVREILGPVSGVGGEAILVNRDVFPPNNTT